ncbi:hypothetical protein ACO1PF_00665 [Alkalibacterium sp. f15]|uniref:hypothetical protein n=1 Tax=Alkalibacterium sp. f15 TaxID=3414029 RepID=UPI003BF91D23
MSSYVDKVNKLHATYGSTNPFELFSKMNIDIRYLDSGDTFSSKQVKGIYKPVIILNSLLKEKNERYFILAYELYFALCSAEVSEKDAHLFAKELLEQLYIDTYGHIPSTAKELERLYGLPDITDASIF